MSLDGNPGRRILGSVALGLFVALLDFGLDLLLARTDIAPATTALNDLIIGSAAASFAYFWMARQSAKDAAEFSRQKLKEETLQNERKRMALELHDTVCQAQTAAIMHLECACDALVGNPEARQHGARALVLVRDSNAKMRCSLWDLYPEELEKADLGTAIESLVKDMTAGDGLRVQFNLEGSIRKLPPDAEKGLLRISQEALSNVVKHAHARDVQVELSLDSQIARLCVKDDGRGFDPEVHPLGLGLTSMQSRVRALGGVWAIQSKPGHGTEVHASIPIPPEIN